jgi:hypothetical protein
MRSLALSCLSSSLFLLPVGITVAVYLGIESQKVLDAIHGKIPPSALIPTVPRPKGPRVIETDMYCNKSYAVLPFPGRYACKWGFLSLWPAPFPSAPFRKSNRNGWYQFPWIRPVDWLEWLSARRIFSHHTPPSGATSLELATGNFGLGADATRLSLIRDQWVQRVNNKWGRVDSA